MFSNTSQPIKQTILIHSVFNETRIAILENKVLQEIHIERLDNLPNNSIVGNIYLGKVIRVLPGIQSAFIDIGLQKTAFLHYADLLIEQTSNLIPNLGIEQRIFTGQTLLVQVLKDPLGSKGARLTTHISITGRYFVLLPQDKQINISKKITNLHVKNTLRTRLNTILPNHFSWGLIVRTQAQYANNTQLTDDIGYLTQVWHTIIQHTKTQAAPNILYQEIGLAERILRDINIASIEQILIDGINCYKQLHTFATLYIPAIVSKIQLYTDKYTVLDVFKINTQINEALNRRVNLNNGSYLIIDQTESMCTIDVNTGSFIGGKQFAQTILDTNINAAKEIARQLRLRNLGGIILIDFIDMKSINHREIIIKELTQALAKDTVPTKLYGFTALGLMELSRKRTKESLAHILLEPCIYCDKTAHIKTVQTVAYDILHELQVQICQSDGLDFTVYTHPKVVAWFKQYPNYLTDISRNLKQTIHVLAFDNGHWDKNNEATHLLPLFKICVLS